MSDSDHFLSIAHSLDCIRHDTAEISTLAETMTDIYSATNELRKSIDRLTAVVSMQIHPRSMDEIGDPFTRTMIKRAEKIFEASLNYDEDEDADT